MNLPVNYNRLIKAISDFSCERAIYWERGRPRPQ